MRKLKQPPSHYLFDFLAAHPKSIGVIFIAMLVAVQALFLRDPVKMILMFIFLVVARFLGYFEAMWESVEEQLEREEQNDWTTRLFTPIPPMEPFRYTFIAGEDLRTGQYVRLDPVTGKLMVASQEDGGFFAIRGDFKAGETVSIEVIETTVSP